MNTQELVKKCLIDKDALAEQPFTTKGNEDIYVVRHKSNNKWFALIFILNDKLSINLKGQPDLLAVLREQYEAVAPAWHMNKKHWCTVDVNNIPEEVLEELIKISFDITAPKAKRGERH